MKNKQLSLLLGLFLVFLMSLIGCKRQPDIIDIVSETATEAEAPPKTRADRELQRALETENAYAIVNVSTGIGIRPLNSDVDSDLRVVHDIHNDWMCMTWQRIGLGGDVYLLRNLFTHKTFQPSSLEQGADLRQQTLDGNSLHHWEFIRQADETYLIKLVGTELYLTATSSEIESDIVLLPLENSARQQWQLIEQRPLF